MKLSYIAAALSTSTLPVAVRPMGIFQTATDDNVPSQDRANAVGNGSRRTRKLLSDQCLQDYIAMANDPGYEEAIDKFFDGCPPGAPFLPLAWDRNDEPIAFGDLSLCDVSAIAAFCEDSYELLKVEWPYRVDAVCSDVLFFNQTLDIILYETATQVIMNAVDCHPKSCPPLEDLSGEELGQLISATSANVLGDCTVSTFEPFDKDTSSKSGKAAKSAKYSKVSSWAGW